jgi:hypothetical protein
MPVHGEIVNCDMCQKPYSYFVWAFGSVKCLCRRCVNRRPSAYLDDIDPIDIEKEQDIIYNEIAEQEERDFPKQEKRGRRPFVKVNREHVHRHSERSP